MSEPSSDPADRTRGPGEVFCRNCGATIDERAEICPTCGVRQRPPPRSAGETVDDLVAGGNPFVAALLSALFPGLGQIYNRELEKGLAIIVVSVLTLLSAVVLVGFVLFPIVWIYAIYDAYTVAERGTTAADAIGTEAGAPGDATETARLSEFGESGGTTEAESTEPAPSRPAGGTETGEARDTSESTDAGESVESSRTE